MRVFNPSDIDWWRELLLGVKRGEEESSFNPFTLKLLRGKRGWDDLPTSFYFPMMKIY
jgi:hypothetical protein